MPEKPVETTFHFVDWSDVLGPNRNPATRVLIRKQAMSKAAAARRERGQWGKRNLGQSIVILPKAQDIRQRMGRIDLKPSADHRILHHGSSTSSSSDGDSVRDSVQTGRRSGHDDTSSDLEQGLTRSYTIPPQMASSGYEMLRMKCNFDILDLSALTTFHVGRITTEGLYASPTGLVDVLQCRQWSYFSYIPCRFGHFPYLDDAARCVARRVRGWVEGEVKPSVVVISLYLKALNSLQAALNDPVLCTEPETLCATALLSIYELLDNTRGLGWAQHAAGARSLVRLRGPQRFQTSFEKALFMAQVGPMYTESLAENLDCFLQDAAWQTVLRSVLDEHPATEALFSDRGTVVVLLWSDLVYLPSLWKDVQAVVCSDDFISSSDLQELQSRVTSFDKKLSQWRSTYEPLLLSIPDPIYDVKAEKRFETLALCLTCLIILKRLAIALDPLIAWSSELEKDAQLLGEKILEIEKRALSANPRAALFMMFKKQVALATIQTTQEWRVFSLVDARVGANGLIAKWVYEHWCTLKGRKVKRIVSA